MSGAMVLVLGLGPLAAGVVIGFVLGWAGCERLNGAETRREQRDRRARQASEAARALAVVEALTELVALALAGPTPQSPRRPAQREQQGPNGYVEQVADMPRLTVGVL